jgi:predicted  nucleic acid-binding Zn-ribbon protein
MRQIMAKLFSLQKLQLRETSLSLQDESEILHLRDTLPASLLVQFDRFIARGKKAVALAPEGVCSECHLHITPAKLAALIRGLEAQVCDNCGRYVYLPDSKAGWPNRAAAANPRLPKPKLPAHRNSLASASVHAPS